MPIKKKGNISMPTLSSQERSILLKIARSAIASRLRSDVTIEKPETVAPTLKEKRGCFVTLHQKGVLRGCIGTIEPITPLIDCVEENALNAAFRDPRFPPLKIEDLDEIEIEVSVLTEPERIEFSDGEDLKNKLKAGIHGVIVSRGIQRATFLPQVWEQLPDKENFLDQLCQKGGMPKKSWKDRKTIVKVYEVEYFSEN